MVKDKRYRVLNTVISCKGEIEAVQDDIVSLIAIYDHVWLVKRKNGYTLSLLASNIVQFTRHCVYAAQPPPYKLRLRFGKNKKLRELEPRQRKIAITEQLIVPVTLQQIQEQKPEQLNLF